MRGLGAAAIATITFSFAWQGAASAEVSEVKIVAQNGSNYLPLFVMQGNKLVEKRLASKGLGSTTVTWTRLAGPSAIVDGTPCPEKCAAPARNESTLGLARHQPDVGGDHGGHRLGADGGARAVPQQCRSNRCVT
ncbi:MAG: hypothetical protein AB7O44_05750 [Hyphomicrobiaceae bacterium]